MAAADVTLKTLRRGEQPIANRAKRKARYICDVSRVVITSGSFFIVIRGRCYQNYLSLALGFHVGNRIYRPKRRDVAGFV